MSTPIPQTQRAAVLQTLSAPYTITPLHPVPSPSSLAAGECLVRLEYSGVCHSDLHIMKGDWSVKARTTLPLVGGHEGVGRVVAIGKGGKGRVKVGTRVGVKWIGTVCHTCEMCRKGFESACERSFQETHGFKKHGTFQEYVVSYLNYVTPIPEGLDSAAATPILCAGVTVYKALKQANLSVGQWVAISGAGGGLGHLGVQYAVAMGFRVVAIDTGSAKRDLVLRLGAEKWVDFRESGENLVTDVQAAAGGGGPQAAIVVAGSTHPFNQALMYLRRTGTLVAVGVPAGDAVLNVPLPLIIARSLTIVGTLIGSQQDVVEALDLAARGKVKAEFVVRELEELNEIFEDMEAGKTTGRVVLRLVPDDA